MTEDARFEASAGVRLRTAAGQHRVVVTGIGVISSIGTGLGEFANGLRAGRSGARPVSSFSTEGFEYRNACEVTDFAPTEWIRRVPLEELGRAGQFAVAAARMAVGDAGLADEQLRAGRALVAVGTTDGESRDLGDLTEVALDRGATEFDPVVARRYPAHRLSAGIAREFELEDVEALTIPTACSAGNYAIGSGLDALREGDVDVALCGGADAACRKTFAAFYRLGTIAPEVCQPFDADRKGILTGEGAAVLVLETLERALARGARIYVEVLGYGLACDAIHPTAPDRDSIARTIAAAHRDARVRPEQIDFISAHGTGTRANDVTEVAAIRQVFGSVPIPPTVSIKSMIGHSMGAASAIAAVACAVAVGEGFIPPTINHVQTDPECGVDCVPNHARVADLEIVQNNGLAFGGNNAVVILRRYPAAAGAETGAPEAAATHAAAAAAPAAA
jgi:3-oxoacyl-[acyl-carrier-protein] synthase II